jgi:hypothetical protein
MALAAHALIHHSLLKQRRHWTARREAIHAGDRKRCSPVQFAQAIGMQPREQPRLVPA